MLELYRASAGSGKTYTLAKKYIWYFLTIKPEEGPVRLRTDEELADSARHILAVTFTNKATNEMQTRIVEALHDLALIRKKKRRLDDGTETEVMPDYMDDFCRELSLPPEEIARVSETGLSTLLENYSDFNVSTIDSFFQTVLRTFAYESDLNDSYQVEMDTDFLSRLGVDAALQEIDSNDKDTTTPFWIRTLIDRTAGGKWNIFTRNMGANYKNIENPYKDLVKSVENMETEDYKGIRHEIEEYFERHGADLPELYTWLYNHYEPPVDKAFRRVRTLAREALRNLPDELKTASSRSSLGKPAYYLGALADPKKVNRLTPDDKLPKYPEKNHESGPWKKWAAASPEDARVALEALGKVRDAVEDWRALLSDPGFRHWMLYASRLPYFALFGIVARKRQEYLDENNAVELGETSMILNSVIGESDTPFVYERLGTYLNHFLIDEFQDTSKMQWTNLSPLLRESLSRRNGNLIIGDAKQSIYRFRNADPSLITSVVPEEFGEWVTPRGLTPAENTNYRSDLRVVQFNNSFFRFLTSALDEKTEAETPGRLLFGPLYSNVVQRPNKKSDSGYIEIRVDVTSKKRNNDGPPAEAPDIPGLILGLLARGYRQREIAVLVSSHLEGEAIIDSIIARNAALGPGEEKIRFVSEQSLKVASSRAVGIITGVLYNLAKGSNPKINDGEERIKKGVGNWKELAANFKYFSLNNPDRSTAENLNDFISGGADFDILSDLLKEMQSLAIPALTEAIAATFLPESLRASDAVFISAFQDIVLEYCEVHPTDIGSFLKWWDRKKEKASIASPENTDAVQIITVHKSKGLQYECVIVPYADWKFNDGSISKPEWRWVKPAHVSHPEIPMPPFLPVETTKELENTVHRDLLYTFYDQVRMDRLNAAYVAFTRAKKELYIFSTCPDTGLDSSIGGLLIDFLRNREASGTPVGNDEEKGALLPGDVIGITEKPFKASIGTPVAEAGKDREEPPKLIPLKSYDSVRIPSFLKYKPEQLSVKTEIDDPGDEDEQDLDIRSEGNLKHAVLERVNTFADLPGAVRHLYITGLLTDTLADSVEKDLTEALKRPEVARWFDGTAKVINERPVLQRGYVTRRPDRLLIYPDGSVNVVDYKFGKVPSDNRHKKQIGRYVNLLRETRRYGEVRGYLWYVNENRIIEITGNEA